MTSVSIIAKPDPGTGGTGTSRWSWPPPPSSPSSLPISAAPPGPRPSPNPATQANGTKGVRHRKRRDTHTELANSTRNPSALRKAHIRRSIPPCLHMGLVPMATNPPVRRGPLSSTTTAQYATVVLAGPFGTLAARRGSVAQQIGHRVVETRFGLCSLRVFVGCTRRGFLGGLLAPPGGGVDALRRCGPGARCGVRVGARGRVCGGLVWGL